MEKDLLVLAEKLRIHLTIEVIDTTIIMKGTGCYGEIWNVFQAGIKYKDENKVHRPYKAVTITERDNIEEIYANI